jgi:hypothetical protein
MGLLGPFSLALILALSSISIQAIGVLAMAGPAFALSLSSLLNNEADPKFKLIHVADLARLMRDPNGHVYIFDANPPDIRANTGTIPGARLIAYSDFNVTKELPPDKNARLVFYCHNFR